MPVLDLDELTILTAWAEGVSEAAAYAPESIDLLLTAAALGATWRAELDLPEPSARLADAIEALGRVTRAASPPAGASSFDAMLTAAQEEPPAKQPWSKWSGARCSQCSRNGGPDNQSKPAARVPDFSAMLNHRLRSVRRSRIAEPSWEA